MGSSQLDFIYFLSENSVFFYHIKTVVNTIIQFFFPLCLFRLTGWVLLRLFNGFFWSIQIHKGQLEMVKKAATEVCNSNGF